jgi:hypothetical protein
MDRILPKGHSSRQSTKSYLKNYHLTSAIKDHNRRLISAKKKVSKSIEEDIFLCGIKVKSSDRLEWIEDKL